MTIHNDIKLSLLEIIKEDGIADLPMSCKSKLSQAIKEERVHGRTTEKAQSLFAQALELETPTVSG